MPSTEKANSESRFDRAAWERSGKPLAVDYGSGKGGWVDGLQAAGFYVVAVDLRFFPENHADQFIVADVRTLDGRVFEGAAVAVGSPPCNGFSEANCFNPHLALPSLEQLELLLHFLRVMRETNPRFWAVENVRGAVPWFEPLLGKPRLANRPWYIWGQFPAFLVGRSKFKNKTGDLGLRGRGPRRIRNAAIRSKLPGELTGPFASACMEALHA